MPLEPRPIMSGLFGNTTVNSRLREIIEYINALEGRIAVLEGGAKTAPVQEYKDPETATANQGYTAEAFDFQSCDDASILKKYAFAEYGMTITGNKKAETIIKEIQAHIESLEG